VSDAQSAIVLSVDRLRAAYLGCYGNTWIATPAINRLATEAFVFDEAHAAGLELHDFLRAAWTVEGRGLIQRIAGLGRRTALVTDDASAARWAAAEGFDEVIELPAASATHAAADLEATHTAGVIAAAIEQLDALRQEPYLFWLHLAGLGQTWDAPREFRERYHEEDDAPLPTFVAPPCKLLGADFDPDERWGYALAYAAQVSALDACLDHFFERLRETPPLDRTLLMLCGVRGYPLGEHRRVGPIDGSLYGETLHVPWIARLPGMLGAMERSARLVGPGDFGASLARLLEHDGPPSGASALEVLCGARLAEHERLVFQSSSGESALRTPEWFLRCVPSGEDAEEVRRELYVKPDDRWEVNDVRDRCVDVVEELEIHHRGAEGTEGGVRE